MINKKLLTCEYCKNYIPYIIKTRRNETPYQAKLRHIKEHHPRIFKKYYNGGLVK